MPTVLGVLALLGGWHSSPQTLVDSLAVATRIVVIQGATAGRGPRRVGTHEGEGV